MTKISCPYCGYNKEYESLPSHASYVKCPRCHESFRITLAEQERHAASEVCKSEHREKLLSCPSCNSTTFAEDGRCYACGKILVSALPIEGPAVELKTSRFFCGCACIALSVVLLGITLSPASFVSDKGFRGVSNSEGAEILLFLGIAWVLVIILGALGGKLMKPTPVKSPTPRKHH